jgi:hypothetical protein
MLLKGADFPYSVHILYTTRKAKLYVPRKNAFQNDLLGIFILFGDKASHP